MKQKNKELIILIDSGNIFEGDLSEFEDCFFYLPKDITTDEKIQAIQNWCKDEGFSFSYQWSA